MSAPGASRDVPAAPGVQWLRLRGSPRRALAAARRVWRRSLQLRVVAIAVLLSILAVLAAGLYMSASIGAGLFDDRVDQVLDQSARAAEAAQGEFDAATSTDPTALLVVQGEAFDQMRRVAASLDDFVFFRVPGSSSSASVQDVFTDEARGLVSPALQATLEAGQVTQPWQSVTVRTDEGTSPGIVVAERVEVPSAGEYELYLIYDIGDVQDTLDFVQRTLLVGSIGLVLVVGAVTVFVVRLVLRPVREAAETSERLAAGQLDRRIAVRGEDVLATLGRSFNRMADGLQRQIRELADLSRVQQRFVSDVSHELRTPLTTIRLASDVLYDQRDEFAPVAARTAELMHDQVDRFEVLLADLLEISRHDARAAELDVQPTNLVALTEDAVLSFESLAAQKGTAVTVVAPGGHVDVDLDPRRVRRIVRNLLANAIEHGEGRPVEIVVDSDAEAIALLVRDHGIGMRRDDVLRVFDRFWRADPSRKRTTGGTGLGLAISLEDAQLHGGWLEVWSEEGRGTAFRLTLPRTPRAPLTGSPIPDPEFGAPAGTRRDPAVPAGGRSRR